MDGGMIPTVVVPHYGDNNLLAECLAALALHTPGGFRLCVWDNNQQNIGFAAGCNIAAHELPGEALVFLNNDCFVHPGWWPPISRLLQDPKVGIVGSLLLYPDGRVQHAGVGLRLRNGVLEGFNLQEPAVEPAAVTGALMTVRRGCWDELCGFDEQFYNGYEDLDLCLRARAQGWQVRFASGSQATHLESQSGPERWRRVRENVMLLQERWFGKVEV